MQTMQETESFLTPGELRTYRLLRWLLFIFFGVSAVFFLFFALFPTISFSFDFNKAKSLQNSLVDPINTSGDPNLTGSVEPDDSLTVHAGLLGDFSTATVRVTSSDDIHDSPLKITLHKGYRSFLAPIGNPARFSDGVLLTYESKYYLVSDDALMFLGTQDQLRQLGWDSSNFLPLNDSEYQLYANSGSIISWPKENNLPEGILLHIENVYYQLQDGSLRPFVSDQAFLSQFKPEWASEQDRSLLDRFPPKDNISSIGFGDGTLFSFDGSAFIASGATMYPVINPITFEASGYLWNDILQANSEEVSLYQRGKIFALASAHPDGTIFTTSDTHESFLFSQGMLHKLLGSASMTAQGQHSPIIINMDSRDYSQSCTAQRHSVWFGDSYYTCQIALASLPFSSGKNYVASISSSSGIHISQIRIGFSQNFTLKNARSTLSTIKQRILQRYVQIP